MAEVVKAKERKSIVKIDEDKHEEETVEYPALPCDGGGIAPDCGVCRRVCRDQRDQFPGCKVPKLCERKFGQKQR